VTAAMAVATVLAAVVTRRRALVLCAVWFVALWAPLTLLGGVIDPHHVALHVEAPRYWVPLLPALALGAAGLLALPAASPGHPLRLAAVGVLAAAVVLVYAIGDLRYVAHAGEGRDEAGWTDARWSALRSYLHEHSALVPAVASDGRTAVTLDFMYRYAPIGGAVRWHGRVDVLPGGRRRHRRPGRADTGGVPLLWSRYTSPRPPRAADGWRTAWRSDNGALAIYLPRT
jgi:hypothetical protein